MTWRRPVAVVLAVGLDLAAGEPSARWHPVVWLGRALGWAERRAPGRSIADGAAAVMAVTTVAWAAARVVAIATRRLGWPGVVLEALALKPAFAVRRLAEATGRVESALRAGDLAAARARVGRDLVSRPTGELTADEVASAAIESVAENLVDSIAAPVLAYALGGLPAAWTYRAVNTADAMWGYRDSRYEQFGKAAARLDDIANLVPARLGATVLAAGAALAGEDGRGAVRVAWAEHGRTASPNAGCRWRRWRARSASASRSAASTGSDRGRFRPRPTRSAGRGRSWAGRPPSPSHWRRALRSCGGTDPHDAPQT